AEAQIRAWAVTHQVQAQILRVPGIYAGDRLPLDRITRQLPALVKNDDVFTNHIHADDLAKLIIYVLSRGKAQRVINACDDSDMLMGDYFDLVADAFNLPKPPRVTKQELPNLVEPMTLSFMSESRRIKNHRLSELRFQLTYPTVADFLKTTKAT
ncbi:MAG: SDR family NAD(P)-dependent oxidoreductase, partial [Polynucleobacter victoriensis]